MARTWLSIRVDLVSGRGTDYWPRPGRLFAAARSHRFAQLADAIDIAFARWDRGHLHQFVLTDGRRIGRVAFDDFDHGFVDTRTKLGTLDLGAQDYRGEAAWRESAVVVHGSRVAERTTALSAGATLCR